MDFASDNVSGASDAIIEELAKAARAGAEGTYGTDRWTQAAARQLETIFERPLAVYLVPTGTAANALALAAVTPPWGGVLCHANAHINEDECGAPEFYTGGAKLIGIPGPDGKLQPDALAEMIRRFPQGVVHHVQAAAVSLSQATECGTIYTCDEIAALARVAHDGKLAVHMDGARFANALITLGCSPAEMTWKAGIDVLSFGASKNGAIACEAIVFFDPEQAGRAPFLRKRAGHTLSKGRFLGAQMAAYLRDGHWLALATHANAMAARLADGLLALPGVRSAWPRQVNEIFLVLPRAMHDRLQAAGAHYYEWVDQLLTPETRARPDEVFIRLICSFESSVSAVDAFLAAARGDRTVASSPQ